MNYVYFDKNDLDKNHFKAALGCVLFPLPLLLCPGSKLGRFCANQGLILLIAFFAVKLAFAIVGALLGWIPLIGPLVRLCGGLALGIVCGVGVYLAVKTFNRQPVDLFRGFTLIR